MPPRFWLYPWSSRSSAPSRARLQHRVFPPRFARRTPFARQSLPRWPRPGRWCVPIASTGDERPHRPAHQPGAAPGVRARAAVDQLPPDAGVGDGEAGVAGGVARVVRRVRPGRRRAGAAPQPAPAAALAGVPPRGPGHRLDRRPRRLARPDDPAPQAAGRVRGPDGTARGHPALVGRAGQGGHRRSRRTPPRRPRPHPPGARRGAGGLAAARPRLAAPGRRRRLRGRPAPLQLPGPAGGRGRRTRAPRPTCWRA